MITLPFVPPLAFAPGKIILSGEYAVLFGRRGLAIPSRIGIHVAFKDDADAKTLTISWEGRMWTDEWKPYLDAIIRSCEERLARRLAGTLTIHNALPLGRGMGSSTALIVAVGKAILGEGSEAACRQMEDTFNPGHSGMDLAVIWRNAPILYQRNGQIRPLPLNVDFLDHAALIDTGKPDQPTTEIVAWMKERPDDIAAPIARIAACTERLVRGESPMTVIPDHHRAQVELGVVPASAQRLIADIERAGGVAKVIGAGARAGGGGMVLALHSNPAILPTLAERSPFLLLTQ